MRTNVVMDEWERAFLAKSQRRRRRSRRNQLIRRFALIAALSLIILLLLWLADGLFDWWDVISRR